MSVEFPAYLGHLTATQYPYLWILTMGQELLDKPEGNDLRIIMNRIFKDLARQLAPGLNLHAKSGDWTFKDLSAFLTDLRQRHVQDQQIRDAARDLYRRTYNGDVYMDLKKTAQVLEQSPQIIAFDRELNTPNPTLRRRYFNFFGNLTAGLGTIFLALGLTALAGMLPARAQPLPQEQPAQSEIKPSAKATTVQIQSELTKLFHPEQLLNQAKDLPPWAIQGMVQKAASDYVHIQPNDKSAMDVLKRAMELLQDDLFSAGYMFTWDILNDQFQASFFRLDKERRQIVTMNGKGRVATVEVYPARTVSGVPFPANGTAFERERGVVFVNGGHYSVPNLSSRNHARISNPCLGSTMKSPDKCFGEAFADTNPDEANLLNCSPRNSGSRGPACVWFYLLENRGESKIDDLA